MDAAGKPHIGTSGWSYKHWKGAFYPPDVASTKWLEFYARYFATVEINNSFYRLPKRETFEAWRSRVPDGFTFAVKASRYITHVKKLKGVEVAWERFLSSALGLGDKLGPILFQFPANWHVDADRLAGFMQLLPDGHRYAFEFRHTSWFTPEVYGVLRDKGAALVISDSPEWPTALEVTAPFTFMRMHGGRSLYASNYSTDELSQWVEKVTGFLDRRLDVFIYFNNDAFGYAAHNAIELKRLLNA